MLREKKLNELFHLSNILLCLLSKGGKIDNCVILTICDRKSDFGEIIWLEYLFIILLIVIFALLLFMYIINYLVSSRNFHRNV